MHRCFCLASPELAEHRGPAGLVGHPGRITAGDLVRVSLAPATISATPAPAARLTPDLVGEVANGGPLLSSSDQSRWHESGSMMPLIASVPPLFARPVEK